MACSDVSLDSSSIGPMRVFHDLRSVNLPGPTVLTVGNFDGIHRGHQALIRRLCALAAEARHPGAGTGATSALVTFDPHPLAVLRPQLQHKLLTTPHDRLELMAELGLDIAVLQPFTAELAQLDAREFVALLKTHLGMATLAVGPDFALGRQRSGNLETLRMLGKELGYDLVVMQPVDWQGRSVRSSTIRQALLEGNVAEAAGLLGRFYRIHGEVVRGRWPWPAGRHPHRQPGSLHRTAAAGRWRLRDARRHGLWRRPNLARRCHQHRRAAHSRRRGPPGGNPCARLPAVQP